MSPGMPTLSTIFPLAAGDFLVDAKPAAPGRTSAPRTRIAKAATAARRTVLIAPPSWLWDQGIVLLLRNKGNPSTVSTSPGPLPGLGIQQGGGLAALEGGDQVLGGQPAHGDPGVDRGAPQVGDDGGILQLQEGGVNLGLFLEDVEPRGEDLARPEGLGQRRLVDDRTP